MVNNDGYIELVYVAANVCILNKCVCVVLGRVYVTLATWGLRERERGIEAERERSKKRENLWWPLSCWPNGVMVV